MRLLEPLITALSWVSGTCADGDPPILFTGLQNRLFLSASEPSVAFGVLFFITCGHRHLFPVLFLVSDYLGTTISPQAYHYLVLSPLKCFSSLLLVPVTFREVAACFSENERKLLHDWQNELYTNLMKGIHQALISLGPVFAASIFSLRAEESEDARPADDQSSERGNIVNHSPGNDVTNVTSASFKEEKKDDFMEHQDSKDMPNKHCPTVSHMGLIDGEQSEDNLSPVNDVTEVIISASFKEENETDLPVYQDSNELQRISCPSDITNIEGCSKDHQQAETKGNLDNPLAHEPNTESKTEKNLHTCTACKQRFAYNFDLIQGANGNAAHFCCAACKQAITNKASLLVHQKPNSRLKPFSCTDCEKSYFYKQHLSRHKVIHSRVPFTCNECEKSFTHKVTLLDHQRIHSGEKPFSCTACDKNFTQKSNLTQHQRTHSGVRPFSCTECAKTFTRKTKLMDHQRTHSGVRPFSCTECAKTFTRKTNCLHHQQTHSGGKALFLH